MERDELEYGSILVPLTGTPLDDDMIQTAGRLAGEDTDPGLEEDAGSTIEALWIFEVPMALPIDARLPDAQLERARAALRHRAVRRSEIPLAVDHQQCRVDAEAFPSFA